MQLLFKTLKVSCALFMVAEVALAQDFSKIQPKEVPKNSTETQIQDGLPETEGSSKVLVSKLQGILILNSIKDVVKTPPSFQGVQAEHTQSLNPSAFSKLTARYLGQPISQKSISSLVKDIILYYRENDRPVVDIIVPEQDITTGILQIVAVEGKLGEVRVEGNKWFSSKQLKCGVSTRPGEEIRSNRILEDAAWINQNPFRDVKVVFTPGSQTGTTDLVLKTQDRFPFRFYTGYEDSGNDLTGDERLLAGFNWGNAFGLGHQLNYQFTTSSDLFNPGADFDNLRAHSVSYLAPLPWKHSLYLFGSISTSAAEAVPFNLNGSSSQLGFRYTIPLPNITKFYQQEVYAGFDWKQSDNSLELGFAPVNSTTTDIGQWVFGYRSTLKDPWGSWSFGPEVVHSPGEYFGHQTDPEFQQVRTQASNDYTYFKFDINRLTRLPWDFTLSNHFTGQFANTNLLGSEQLGVGGYQSVRGYDERELNNTDEGWISRNELRTPPVSLLKLFGVETVKDQLQFLGFFDYASTRAYDGNITRKDGRAFSSESLASVGPGIRYSINNYLSVRADYGFQLNDTGNNRHGSRWHVGVIVSY